MKKFLSVVLAIVMAASMMVVFSSCAVEEEEKLGLTADLLPIGTLEKFDVPETFKIGVICLHDENSTYDKNFISAVQDVQKVLGLTNDQVLIRTGIGEDATCYDAAKALAEAGCNLIFADSFGHEAHVLQAAREYPNVQFCHATGTQAKTAGVSNYHNAFASIYEGRYLAGIAAGAKLKEMIDNEEIKAEDAVIGYVGAFDYAEVISGMTSFYLGAKSICPTATMKVRYTGSWYDQTLEYEAAKSLITTDKCVLISQHADSLGAPTACEEAGVPNVSYNGATYEGNEETFIISSAINWRPYFHYIIKCVVEGKAIDTNWTGTIATGSVVLSGLNQDVAAPGTKALIDAAIASFKDIKNPLHVFDTAKDNFITKNGEKITSYEADIDGDYAPDTNVVHDGYFDESNSDEFRSAPYFDILIDGVTELNKPPKAAE